MNIHVPDAIKLQYPLKSRNVSFFSMKAPR